MIKNQRIIISHLISCFLVKVLIEINSNGHKNPIHQTYIGMDDMNCWAVSAVGTYKLISIIQTIA
jgi:hypothetical protein